MPITPATNQLVQYVRSLVPASQQEAVCEIIGLYANLIALEAEKQEIKGFYDEIEAKISHEKFRDACTRAEEIGGHPSEWN